MKSRFIASLDRKYYPQYRDHWDDQLFRDVILGHVDNNTMLLDVGAGTGAVEEMNFRGVAKEVCGVDPAPRVLKNPYLDRSFVGFGDAMPYLDDEQFDAVISDNVLEHVKNGHAFFSEIYRVLKKDGVFLTKTPNKYHYIPLFARITPTWFHKFYNRLRGRKGADTFPTLYRLNTRKAQTEIAIKTGFAVPEIACYEGRPEYLRLTFPTYCLGLIYERMVNRLSLDSAKVLLISRFEKP